MLSPGQPRSLHSAVFRYMWSLTGQKDVLGGLLTSGQKRKVVCVCVCVCVCVLCVAPTSVSPLPTSPSLLGPQLSAHPCGT